MSSKGRAFRRLVTEALEQIPSEFQPYLDNVEILIEEAPDEVDWAGLSIPGQEALYGVYLGTPLTERGHDPMYFPDRILLFRRPLMEDFEDPEELRREVAITVLHEIAHHFGISDARLQELGWG